MSSGSDRIVCVILAAGAALRYGTQKLTEQIGSQSLIEHALAAAHGLQTIVVAAPSLAAHIATAHGRTIVVNAHPEAGMSRSLQLADRLVPVHAAIAVLLADMPNVDAALLARIAAAYGSDVDIVDPRAGPLPAHPVIFGPLARARIAALPRGDTLRELRGAPDLRRRTLELSDPAMALDVDRPADLARAPRSPSSRGTIGPTSKL